MGLRSSRCDVCNAFADLKCTGYGRDAHTRASADELQAETRCSHGAAPGVLGMTQRMRVCTEMGQCAEIGWVRICRRWSQARSTGGRRRLVVGARWVGRKAVRALRSAACDYPTDHALHGACAHTASISGADAASPRGRLPNSRRPRLEAVHVPRVVRAR